MRVGAFFVSKPPHEGAARSHTYTGSGPTSAPYERPRREGTFFHGPGQGRVSSRCALSPDLARIAARPLPVTRRRVRVESDVPRRMNVPESPRSEPQVEDAVAASSPVDESSLAAIARLRAEVEHAGDPLRRARLLYEIGELQEQSGNDAGATSDYLASYAAEPEFREALEALLRTLGKARSSTEYGRLLETLGTAAETSEERARAHVARAAFLESTRDHEGAKNAYRDALESGASPTDLAPAWLGLETVAAKLEDSETRREALLGRAELEGDATWRGLLLIDAAALVSGGEAGDTERAAELLARAHSLGGAASYPATRALAALLTSADPPVDPAEASKRARKASLALEAEADLIAEAVKDPERGKASGVPRSVDGFVAVERYLRASEASRTVGDYERSRALLDRALDVTERTEGAREKPSAARKLVLHARIRVAVAMGETALAAKDASDWLPHEEDGPLAASLAMAVAEEAASRGAGREALEAVTLATSRDPKCIPARALELDLLADSDIGAFATRLSTFAEHFPTPEAKGRAALLVAYLAGTKLADRARVEESLTRARENGVSAVTVARVGRSLAKVLGADDLYTKSTEDLLSALADEPSDEAPLLAFELVRAKALSGDHQGASAARARLEALPNGATLAKLVSAFLPGHHGQTDSEEARRAITASLAQLDADADADADADEPRMLAIVHALAAHALGDLPAAVSRAKKLAEENASDAFLAFFYLDLERQNGQTALAAADLLVESAEKTADPSLGAAMHLEAAILRYREGRAADASRAFASARELSPAAGNVAYAWALRGVNLESPDERRRALAEATEHAGRGEWALERFANGLAAGDPDEARAGLETAHEADHVPIELAAALGVLASADAEGEADAVDRALRKVALLGPEGSLFAAGERARLARDLGHEDLAEAAGSWFSAGGGLASAVEWVSASLAAGDGLREVTAREALAEAVSDESREALVASARLLDRVLDASAPKALVSGTTHAVRLANLELSPPGADPRRRAAALDRLGNALGDEMDADIAALSAWSTYYSGDKRAALELFRAATGVRVTDLASWEGVRTCAFDLGDNTSYAVACEQLGARTVNAARGAVYWEQAGLMWLDLGQESRAEAALDQAVYRDPGRIVAFDKLFRRVRDRKDSDKVLDLVERRLGHTDDNEEIARLYWEQSRALREKGDMDGALYALENVRTIEPDHVGALALMGEIYIRRGAYEEAASHLSRLAHVDSAPPKSRVTAGVAAVDLYENKLSRNDLALEVLLTLHRAKISTLPVRERLARAAARTGSWEPASSILEELMFERETRDGRIEAARLAMVIHRDRLRVAQRAIGAVKKLLDESPVDGEAIDFLVEQDVDRDSRRALLDRARNALVEALQREPGGAANAKRLARVSRSLGEPVLEHAALAVAVATNGPDGSLEQMLAQLSANKPRTPQLAMTDALLRRVLAPGDDGPLAQLFGLLGPTIAEALGPTLASLGVTKKERVDQRSGLALRNEIAAWAGAFGLAELDLYVGGKDPHAVQGVPGEVPALVVGASVMAPLSPQVRARVARELLSIVRGTVVTRWRDDTTLAAIAVAACNIVKVRIESPPYAILAEVERSLSKAISRKTKNAIEPVCNALAQAPRDAKTWVPRAIASQHRISAIASGDVSIVLADAFGLSLPDLARVAREDLRCAELIRFVLSPDYFDIRRLLGLEASS